MLRTVGGRGFPTIAILTPTGELIGKHSGPRSVEGFAASIDKASGLVEARAKAAKGDKSAEVDVLTYELSFGLVEDLETAKERLNALENVTPEQKKEIAGLMADLEFSEVMNQRASLGEDALAAKAFEMYEAGRIPTGGRVIDFWYYGILVHARSKKDAELALKAVNVLAKTEIFKSRRYAKMLDEIREEIAGFGK